MIKKIIITFIILKLLNVSNLQCNDCYSEYWQRFFWRMWDNNTFAIATYIKIDSKNHFKRIRAYQFNEQFIWQAKKNLSLELHYAYLNGRPILENSKWRWQHRLELEFNPTFPLSCGPLIVTRNRLEIRYFKTESIPIYRWRQRTMLTIPLKNNSLLKSFSIYNELFYNASDQRISQNRICPFQLRMALSNKAELDLYFIFRFLNRDNFWYKSAIIGTQFIF